MTAPQPRDDLDQVLRDLQAEQRRPVPPRPPERPHPVITPARARRNLLTLMHAQGGIQTADQDWLDAHPLPDTGD